MKTSLFNFFKNIKANSSRIKELEKKVEKLILCNSKLEKKVIDNSIFNAIGIPLAENKVEQRRIELLVEAKKRGFFEKDSIFAQIKDSDIQPTAYFKHLYSNITSNYMYFEESDSLRIPVIGTHFNFSSGTICIYKKGKWTKVLKDV